MELVVGTFAIGAIVVAQTVRRITRFAPWQTLAMVAKATGSPRACVDFIRYCERNQVRSSGGEMR